MLVRTFQKARPVAVALALSLLSATAGAQVVPAVPAGDPGTRPAAPTARPEVELRPRRVADSGDTGNARHEQWEKAAYLGVATSPAQPALRQQLHLPRGVGLVVEFIEPGSPADEAGVRQYDVIHKLDDQILVNAQQLAVLVRIHQPGDSIKLTLIREGRPLPIDVKLIEKEVPPLEELRLGNADPAVEGAPNAGENDWPGLVNFPGRRVGMPLPPLPPSDGALHVEWTDGSADLTLSGQGTHRYLVLRDRAGQVLFRGPVDTADQRAGIPKEQRERLTSLPEPFKLPANEPATRPTNPAR